MAGLILSFIWELTKTWLDLFRAPFMDINMLWVIVPVYLSWFFAEFFQEKRRTSLGNAISNGTIALWVGADWMRTTIRLRTEQALAFNLAFFAKIAMAALMFVYGFFIIIEGVRAKKITHVIGRIRVVTYFVLMFTPLFYGYVKPDKYAFSILAIFVFLPVFYFLIELIDKLTPEPAAIKEEEEGLAEKGIKGLGEIGPGLGEQPAIGQQYGQQQYGQFTRYNPPRL